jgi:hypothetical protein
MTWEFASKVHYAIDAPTPRDSRATNTQFGSKVTFSSPTHPRDSLRISTPNVTFGAERELIILFFCLISSIMVEIRKIAALFKAHYLVP